MEIDFDKGPARFCWLDLATVNTRKAQEFYADLFGWGTERKRANGGEYLRFLHGGESFASLYQLKPGQIAAGVPSHWTPYVCVSDICKSGSKAEALGGQVVVNPFEVDGLARLSLIADATGALIGLWEGRK
jgi:predicted enzyme related to lactoylglutathione lyase